jgi:CheY-like chemotaxis protein
VLGLLLAVPLTAFLKLVADLHPSLCHLSNMLALTPRPTPRWVRYSETALERAIPYLRPRGEKVSTGRPAWARTKGATKGSPLWGNPHQHVPQLSRKMCKFDQPWRAQIGDHRGECGEIVGMFHYPGHRTILCIDDEDGLLRYQKTLSERRGYKVLTAASARERLRIAAVCEVAAVVVDYNMPEMNDLEFATEIKRLKPSDTDSHGFQ